MFYKPKYFDVRELVTPSVYERFGEKAFMFIDNRILRTADMLRERFGPITINTWFFGGTSQCRGFRSSDCTIGAAFSQHRFGRALDMSFRNYSAEEIREDMRKNGDNAAYEFITRCEDGVSWLHIDNANIKHNGIYFFKP